MQKANKNDKNGLYNTFDGLETSWILDFRQKGIVDMKVEDNVGREGIRRDLPIMILDLKNYQKNQNKNKNKNKNKLW